MFLIVWVRMFSVDVQFSVRICEERFPFVRRSRDFLARWCSGRCLWLSTSSSLQTRGGSWFSRELCATVYAVVVSKRHKKIQSLMVKLSTACVSWHLLKNPRMNHTSWKEPVPMRTILSKVFACTKLWKFIILTEKVIIVQCFSCDIIRPAEFRNIILRVRGQTVSYKCIPAWSSTIMLYVRFSLYNQ